MILEGQMKSVEVNWRVCEEIEWGFELEDGWNWKVGTQVGRRLGEFLDDKFDDRFGGRSS